jgi:hypothetical protein
MTDNPSGAGSTNMDILREFESLALAGQLDLALQRCVHQEIEVVEPPSLPHGGRWKGREGLREMMETRQSVWDNTFDGFEYWDVGDVIIVYQIITARAKSTGKTASFPRRAHPQIPGRETELSGDRQRHQGLSGHP